MITPDTIITSELLAGLEKCPFCGAEVFSAMERAVQFQCWTNLYCGQPPESFESVTCRTRQRDNLRDRVAELESKLQRLTAAGDYLERDLKQFWSETKSMNEWTQAKEAK